MKHKSLCTTILLTALAFAFLTPSCKPSEKNYRKAYERTMAARDSSDTDFDETIYGRYRKQLVSTPVIVGNDTLDARTQNISVTPDGGGINESIKPYMVVVGGFKQLFNARSLRERLLNLGYPGAFIVQTAEPYYFIVAKACTTPEEALATVKALKANPPIPLRNGYPWALQPARLNR